MRSTLIARLLALASLISLPAIVPAQGAWSRFNDQPGFGIGGRVFALGTWRNELVAGMYKNVHKDGADLNRIGHFDGERWLPFGPGVDGRVRAVLEVGADLYVGGRFEYAGGAPARNIARWDGSRWSPVGAGFDEEVWSLAMHRGELYAAGFFTDSGGQAVSRIARWDGARWQPVGGGMTWNLGVEARIYRLVSDGTLLYAGGEFDRAGGVPASHIAAWDGTRWRDLGGGVNNFGWGRVLALALYGGRLIVGGYFGVAGGVPVQRIAAWDGSAWSPVGGGVTNPFGDCEVWSLQVHGPDLYVGGDFLDAGGVAVQRIARFDGSRFHSIGGVALAEFNPPTVIAMTSWNGRLWCGGEFHIAGEPFQAGRSSAVYHIASYDGSRWAAVGRGLGSGGEIMMLARWRGQIVAGGRYLTAGGTYATNLAVFDGDDWQHIGTLDGTVRGAVEHLGDLYVAGEFYRAEGVVANGVARFDGAQWSALGSGPSLHRALAIAVYQGMIHVGSIGNPRRWNGTAWEEFGSQIFGAIGELHVHNGVLYLGGTTPFMPGTPNLFEWDGSALRVVGGGTDGPVDALASHGGELIVGGSFTAAGGVPARNLARWNGSRFAAFGSGVRGAGVSAIATLRGQLVIGGDFSRFQGENADYVARWDGSAFQSLPGGDPDGYVAALLADDTRNELHIGGHFFRVGGIDSDSYALWQEAPSWTVLGGAVGSPRRTPILWGEGSLWAAATTHISLSSAREQAPFAWALGARRIDVPLLGGTLVPEPTIVLPGLTDFIGRSVLDMPWPPSLRPPTTLYWQGWILDPAGPQGATASNALALRVP